MSSKVAIVTGGNRGIGFYIVKGLCERFQGIVYLTSRDESRGLAAVKRLEEMGLKVKYHVLDVTKKDSVEEFSRYVKKNYGGFDLIVNNASAFFIDNPIPSYEQASTVIGIDYKGIRNVGDVLYSLIKKNGRVVNVSSNDGHTSGILNKELREKLSNRDITIKELDVLVDGVLERIKCDKLLEEEKKCGYFEYRLAKAAAYVLSTIHAKQLASRNISVNCPHPGFCQTDASNFQGTMTAEQGSSSILYAALDAPQDLTGKFIWCNNEVVDWYDATIPSTEMLYCTKDDPSPYPNQKIEKKDNDHMSLQMLAQNNS